GCWQKLKTCGRERANRRDKPGGSAQDALERELIMSTDRYTRWRLVLGRAADQGLCQLAGRGSLLDGEQANLDEALGQIYGSAEGEGDSPKQRSAGLGASAPRLAKWLGDVRSYFSKDVVAVIQKDAIEKKGLKQLLFEPETLGQVTPNIEMVGTLL